MACAPPRTLYLGRHHLAFQRETPSLPRTQIPCTRLRSRPPLTRSLRNLREALQGSPVRIVKCPDCGKRMRNIWQGVDYKCACGLVIEIHDDLIINGHTGQELHIS